MNNAQNLKHALAKKFKLLIRKDMQWIPIDPDNLPEGVVLAANFNPDSGDDYEQTVVGYLCIEKRQVVCRVPSRSWRDEHKEVYGCTHYIDIDKFDL